jgi:hypothetical protein
VWGREGRVDEGWVLIGRDLCYLLCMQSWQWKNLRDADKLSIVQCIRHISLQSNHQVYGASPAEHRQITHDYTCAQLLHIPFLPRCACACDDDEFLPP